MSILHKMYAQHKANEGKFFKLTDFNLENELGKEYLTDLNMIVNIHNVDTQKTKKHALYGESYAVDKIVKPAKELQVFLTVEDSMSEFLDMGGIKKEYAGNLIFNVYDDELENKDVTINYGDYVSYSDGKGFIRYYEVVKNNIVNTGNKSTHQGIKSYWRKIECIPVEKDVFNG